MVVFRIRLCATVSGLINVQVDYMLEGPGSFFTMGKTL
jgi:hypothetical protein